MGDPYAAFAQPVEAPPTGADPYADIGAHPVKLSELPVEHRNALLQERLRQPGVTASDALNYAQELGLTIRSHLNENVGRSDAHVVDVTPPPPPPPPPSLGDYASQFGNNFVHDVAAIGKGIGQLPDLAASGVGHVLGFATDTVGAPEWVGENLRHPFSVNQTIERVVQPRTDVRGQYDEAIGRTVGGSVFGIGVGKGLTTLANPVARRVGEILANSRGAQATAAVAGGTAAEKAHQEGYGPLVQSLVGLGAGAGAGGMAAAFERTPIVPRAPTPGQATYQAADRLGMADKLLPADVGGTPTRMATSVSAMTLGGIPIAEQAAKGVNALAGARNSVAEAAGRVSDATGAGQAAQAGAKNFMAASENRASQLYDAIPIADERPATLSNTRSALSRLTAGLESNPELSAIIADPRLARFEAAIAGHAEQVPTGILDAAGNPIMRTIQKGGQLSWQDLKAFRTYVGEKSGTPALQNDTPQKALKGLYRALSEDMGATANAEGPAAVRAFNRATQYWRGREDRIGNVLNAVLGNDLNKGSMSAFENVNRMGQAIGGDPIKLGRLMRSLPADEADTVRATIIHRMGQARAGAQDATGEVFSPAEFATQWNKMDARAKAVLFNKSDLRQSLNDIAEVASGMKMGQKLANTSKSGLAVNGIALVLKFFSTPALAIGAAGGELTIGKMLSSPILARSLARVSRADTPAALRGAIASIGTVATRASDPGTRAAAAALQARLMNGLNDNLPAVSGAAASPPGSNSQSEQQ